MPLPENIHDALDNIEKATKKLQSLDAKRKPTQRRAKRYEDIARGIRSLRQLLKAMSSIGIKSLFSSAPSEENSNSNISFLSPAFISLDLGLRQRRKHFHGSLLYQAIIMQEDCLEHSGENRDKNDSMRTNGFRDLKIAEGGRYDDLVRLKSCASIKSYLLHLKLTSLIDFFHSKGSEFSSTCDLWFYPIQSLYCRTDSNGKSF